MYILILCIKEEAGLFFSTVLAVKTSIVLCSVACTSRVNVHLHRNNSYTITSVVCTLKPLCHIKAPLTRNNIKPNCSNLLPFLF